MNEEQKKQCREAALAGFLGADCHDLGASGHWTGMGFILDFCQRRGIAHVPTVAEGNDLIGYVRKNH